MYNSFNDMTDLSKGIVEASKAGNFLEFVHEAYLSELNTREGVVNELVLIHNNEKLNIVEEFKKLLNNPDSGRDFFTTRDIFEDALPRLNSPVLPIIECVQHLFKESGHESTAAGLFTPFIDYCSASSSRPDEALRLLLDSPTLWYDFLTSIIVAGCRCDMERYFQKAIKLTNHEEVNIRKNAVFSLGRIQLAGILQYSDKAIDCLAESVERETSDSILGCIIQSTCAICMADTSLSAKGIQIVNTALSKGEDEVMNTAANMFGFNTDKLPEAMLDAIIPYLHNINPKNTGTVHYIDYGISHLLKRSDNTKGIEFLESFLVKHYRDVAFMSLGSTVNSIHKPGNTLLNKLLTRWFLKGDYALCHGISNIIQGVHGENLHLKADKNEFPSLDANHLIFVARKTIGYLFIQPVTCASIITSLIKMTKSAKTLKDLSALLFDPLLLNYSGKTYEFLKGKVECESGKTKEAIQTAIEAGDNYLETLKSVPNIPELYPSQDQRETYARQFNRLMAAEFKAARKRSFFSSICSESILLYGTSSVDYIKEGSGQYRRMETPMQSHGTSIEVARQEKLDPLGLDNALRTFRCERLKSE